MKDQNVIPLKSFIKNIAPRDGADIKLEMNREPRSELQRDCIDRMVKCKSPKLTIEVKPGVEQPAPAYGDMRVKFPFELLER